MSWNPSIFITLFILGFAVTVNSKYRGLPDAIKLITVDGFSSSANIHWDAFEVDTDFYKVELVGVHDGKSITKTVEDTFTTVKGLEPNGTYIVRVFAVNEHGQSPPSPDVILPLRDTGCPKWISDCDSLPTSPYKPDVEYMLGNRVNVTWTPDTYDKIINKDWGQSPAEFIIRYGDNTNTSLWNTRKTNNTWIILDDLKKNTQYSAYVIAKRDNLTSRSPDIFSISLDQEMSGLPEPVITIESAFKKEVYTPGDSMTITCSVPPNTNMRNLDMELTVGERVEYSYYSYYFYFSRSLTLYTTANEDVDTAKCKLYARHKIQASRSSYRSWKVKKPLNDEYLRRRYEEVEADEAFISFRKA